MLLLLALACAVPDKAAASSARFTMVSSDNVEYGVWVYSVRDTWTDKCYAFTGAAGTAYDASSAIGEVACARATP